MIGPEPLRQTPGPLAMAQRRTRLGNGIRPALDRLDADGQVVDAGVPDWLPNGYTIAAAVDRLGGARLSSGPVGVGGWR